MGSALGERLGHFKVITVTQLAASIDRRRASRRKHVHWFAELLHGRNHLREKKTEVVEGEALDTFGGKQEVKPFWDRTR